MYAIYLLQEHQRKGIGRQLTLTVARRLFEDGFRSMLVWVLAESPSRGFYKALGGKPLYEKPLEVGGEELIVAAYGWQELSGLLEMHEQT
jgi:GNAT superfamily N-acetyltransferase